jgi:BNR repeat-containing family member
MRESLLNAVVLNDNGAWSWFMDERAIVHRGKLLVGSIRSTDKSYAAGRDQPSWGNCELAVYDLTTGQTNVVVLHPHFEQDDHDGPSLHVRRDGRVLAIYTRHSVERKVFWRVSESQDLLSWSAERELITPGKDHPPFGGDNVTYSNPFQPLTDGGRMYNFFRSVAHQQNWMYSDDDGEIWQYGGMFLRGHQGYAPYFKYASNVTDSLYFVGTEDHPRNFDNSIFAGFVRSEMIHYSDGRPFAPLSRTTEKSGDIWDLTCVYRGDADHVAWVIDLHLDRAGRPVCVFSTQRDGRGLPPTKGGFDHRFHYARWDGTRWIEHEIAYAGTRLYPYEDDYTGLAAIDPQDTSRVVISTDTDPTTGAPLISRADGLRHRELFLGTTPDGGATWNWTPLTQDSTGDHLRPIIPIWDDPRMALVWMKGRYDHNQGPWNTKVMAATLMRSGGIGNA